MQARAIKTDDRPVIDRDRSLDAFRGFAVLTMVAANFLAEKALVPAWLKHAPDIGLTVIDIIAPLFVVAMALPFRDSWKRKRERSGATAAIWETLRRYFALIGIGAILSAGQSYALPNGGVIDWGVLQALGVAGLGLLCLVAAPVWLRLAIGAAIFAAYQLALPVTTPLVLARSHGGLIGAVDWMAMIIFADAILEIIKTRPRGTVAVAGVAVAAAGAVLSVVVPISKNRVSGSYILVSLGVSLVLLWLFGMLYRTTKPTRRPDFLEVWGRRPLALYLAHQILLAAFIFPPSTWWHEGSPAWLILAQLAALFAILAWLACFLERRSIAFRL
jgi:predicted acyltransferase